MGVLIMRPYEYSFELQDEGFPREMLDLPERRKTWSLRRLKLKFLFSHWQILIILILTIYFGLHLLFWSTIPPFLNTKRSRRGWGRGRCLHWGFASGLSLGLVLVLGSGSGWANPTWMQTPTWTQTQPKTEPVIVVVLG